MTEPIKFTEIARPLSSRARPVSKWGEIARAVIATAASGRAVELPISDSQMRNRAYGSLHRLCRDHGFTLRTRAQGDALICWAEPRPVDLPR